MLVCPRLMWAFMLPKELYLYLLVLPRRPVSYVLVFLFHYAGHWIQNGVLTSEFVRKTQLETNQIAARQIQQTLQPVPRPRIFLDTEL